MLAISGGGRPDSQIHFATLASAHRAPLRPRSSDGNSKKEPLSISRDLGRRQCVHGKRLLACLILKILDVFWHALKEKTSTSVHSQTKALPFYSNLSKRRTSPLQISLGVKHVNNMVTHGWQPGL